MNPLAVTTSDVAVTFDLRNDLRPGDLGAIVSLHGAFYAKECGFDSTFEAYVARYLGELVHARIERDRLWIAEREGRLVGSVAWKLDQSIEGGANGAAKSSDRPDRVRSSSPL